MALILPPGQPEGEAHWSKLGHPGWRSCPNGFVSQNEGFSRIRIHGPRLGIDLQLHTARDSPRGPHGGNLPAALGRWHLLARSL